MNYADLIEKLNVLTHIYCDPMIRCPEFEKAYVRFYHTSKALCPSLFQLTLREKDLETSSCECSSTEMGESADIFLGKEVVGNIPCEALENYLQRK